ncbi:hypothetical protein ACU5JM_01755 (plasmid) [Rhodococcus erythropolis]|uniref:hypothetical protein n=1 Tax=Rhodococcus erythropolis TaxID=1833 RepID=UPI00406BBD4F
MGRETVTLGHAADLPRVLMGPSALLPGYLRKFGRLVPASRGRKSASVDTGPLDLARVIESECVEIERTVGCALLLGLAFSKVANEAERWA